MSTVSASDPAAALVAMTTQARSTELSAIFVKQEAKQNRSLVDMLAAAAAPSASAPPPGQGTMVDRLA